MLANILGSLLRYPLRARRARRAGALHDAAMAQKEAGDYAGARRSLEQAVALDPDHAQAHYWLGIALAREQAFAESATHLERALVLDPTIPEGWIDLGNVLALQRNFPAAVTAYRKALAAVPDSTLARLNLGHALKEMGHLQEALDHLRRVHELAPGTENAVRNLVSALIESDRCEEALAIAADAVARDPARYEYRFAHGLALQKSHEPFGALAEYDAALRARPDDAELHDNRGTALLELGRLREAIAAYERALALRPDFPLPAFHRALTCLLQGDYAGGWEGYELRLLDRDYPGRAYDYPRWEGGALDGLTLLVTREQGLGDEIMFASCLPSIMEAAGHCIVECEPRLLGLFRRSFPAATVFASTPDGALPREVTARKVDAVIPAGSIPRLLRKGLSDFPRHSGYLRADHERVARWRERLAQLGPGLKVGISWRGGVRKTRRAVRSISLERWLPIFEVPAAHFISLQYTANAEAEIEQLRAQQGRRIEHWAEAVDDLDETAALLIALDLTISVCTAVIHLGGALGRPVWVMAPYSPEWRYGFSGDTMPWYPSVKVFRQPAFGEWEPVTSSVAAELRRLTGAPSDGRTPKSGS
jgi:tetratricopeptide (TPR) repeat protein